MKWSLKSNRGLAVARKDNRFVPTMALDGMMPRSSECRPDVGAASVPTAIIVGKVWYCSTVGAYAARVPPLLMAMGCL